jgi:phage-related protein
MANPAVVVDFVANTRDLQAGFRSASSASTGFGSKLKSLAKGAAIAAGGAGLAGLTAAVKIGIDEFTEHSKVAAQTVAVLKSTHGAANVSAKAIEDLAGALMKKSGVDDETIQSGENLLLTFTRIRNEAGKGNDIFTRATKTALDMSVALGQDMKTSALQLGKALNDPIKGVTALQRVGVTFTAGQKETIKSLVEHGKTLEAQKVILAELNKEFGGSAEALGKTLPGEINIAKQTFNNWMGDLVTKAIPVIQNLIQLLRDNWPTISAAITSAWNTIGPIFAALGQDIAAAAKLIRDNWSTIGPIVMGAVVQIQTAASIIVPVLKLLAALLRGDWSQAWQQLKAVIVAVWNGIVTTITTQIATIKAILTLAWNALKALTSTIWAGIRAAVTAALNLMETAVTGTTGTIKSLITTAWNTIRNTTSSAWSSVRATVNDVIGDVKGFIQGLASWLSGTGHNLISGAVSKIKAVFSDIRDGAETAVSGVKSAINGLIGFLEGIVGRVRSAAGSVANAIKSPINAVIGAWNSLEFPRVSISIPSVKVLGHKIGGGSFGFGPVGFPDIPYLAAGAVVDQPTLAVIGEQGRELVTPENLLRQILAETRPEVRVFIGDTELRGIVRAEVVDANTGLARTLLAGGAA